jgi:hypothetical protein
MEKRESNGIHVGGLLATIGKSTMCVTQFIPVIFIRRYDLQRLICFPQRLMAKDLDSWEQKRVQRFKGEPDGRL